MNRPRHDGSCLIRHSIKTVHIDIEGFLLVFPDIHPIEIHIADLVKRDQMTAKGSEVMSIQGLKWRQEYDILYKSRASAAGRAVLA